MIFGDFASQTFRNHIQQKKANSILSITIKIRIIECLILF